MEHEQDTVLQLQEVIEQLRNVFPSEPGEFARAARSQQQQNTRETKCLALHHPRESERWRAEQIEQALLAPSQ